MWIFSLPPNCVCYNYYITNLELIYTAIYKLRKKMGSLKYFHNKWQALFPLKYHSEHKLVYTHNDDKITLMCYQNVHY